VCSSDLDSCSYKYSPIHTSATPKMPDIERLAMIQSQIEQDQRRYIP